MNPHLHIEMMRAHNAALDRKANAVRQRPERGAKAGSERAYRLRRLFQQPVPRHA